MSNLTNKEKTKYYNFLNSLAKKLTKIYFSNYIVIDIFFLTYRAFIMFGVIFVIYR